MEKADDEVYFSQGIGSPERGSESAAEMETNVEPVKGVVAPEHPHVLVWVGLTHALSRRKEFPLG